MSITLDQIILDAQRIANRLKDREALGNALLVEAEGINRQLETMKQFQDDIDSLNQLSRDKSNSDMVNRINQQNPSIREIRQENRELKACLEDHQRALEHIMHKYREHTQHKIFNSRINFKELYNANLSDVIYKQSDKISEMAAIMQTAASVDDENVNKEIECINRLKIENQGLREMLQISQQFGSDNNRIGHECKSIQTTALADTESLPPASNPAIIPTATIPATTIPATTITAETDNNKIIIENGGVGIVVDTILLEKLEKIDNNKQQQKDQTIFITNGENNNNNKTTEEEMS